MTPAVIHKRIRKAGCAFLGAVLLIFVFLPAAGAAAPANSLEPIIEAAFDARRAHTVSGQRLLSDPAFLAADAGSGAGDWIAFAMARYGSARTLGSVYYYPEDYAAYAAALEKKLEEFYAASGVKPNTKITEYFRMGIALTALGGDASRYIAAATLENPTALRRIPLLSLDYGLIALCMKPVTLTGAPARTVQELVEAVLGQQKPDGGWSLMQGASDVDVTAMTLTALAPFCRGGNAAVKTAVNKALSFLSGQQRQTGDFGSYGVFNAESTAQVLTALTSLDIDPLSDARFIKNGKTVQDGLLAYRLPDGSFTHSYTSDPQNGAAAAGGYNYLATDQAAYALVALWRQQTGRSPLYDLQPEDTLGPRTLFQKIVSLLRELLARLKQALTLQAGAETAPDALLQTAKEIVDYKKASLGKAPEEPLFSGDFLKGAGSTAGDWYPFGMAALGLEDDYPAYLAALRENVRQRYAEEGGLSSNKATEWHRVTLAALACGADPTRFTLTADGAGIDLLRDGVFYRKNITRQGINGCIWALIALHARPFAAPADALNTEATLARTLLDAALPGGGWNMRGTAPDTDVTAMAIMALAPLYETDAEARAALDLALNVLSAAQLPTGGFAEEGAENCESSAVVLTALCCMGIDPEADARFIKNGRTALDALLSYRLPDGSFTHAFVSDPENPEAVPNQPNDMSCQQALYALAALYRLRAGGAGIFDFSAAAISDAGYDVLPAEPGAAEQALDGAKKAVTGFFADEAKRKTAVSAALALCILLLAAALAARAAKKRKAKRDV